MNRKITNILNNVQAHNSLSESLSVLELISSALPLLLK